MYFPRLVVGELNRATRSVTDLSGKGVNVSVALRRFGLPSVLTGFSAGVYGRVLVEGLRKQGYVCDFVEVQGETRSNVTVIDAETGVTTKLNEPGPTVDEGDIAALEARLVERFSRARDRAGDAVKQVCIFSGSLPPGAPVDTYARLIQTLSASGVITVLDTSGEALRAGCAARPAWLKPNEVEAIELTGCAPEDLSAARLPQILQTIRQLGPQRVLLSLGARGACYDDGKALWMAEPPRIRELSAVAAGDASLAGALWAWLSGQAARAADPSQIVRWAVAAGTATAAYDGSGIPPHERIAAVYTQVKTRCLCRVP